MPIKSNENFLTIRTYMSMLGRSRIKIVVIVVTEIHTRKKSNCIEKTITNIYKKFHKGLYNKDNSENQDPKHQ